MQQQNPDTQKLKRMRGLVSTDGFQGKMKEMQEELTDLTRLKRHSPFLSSDSSKLIENKLNRVWKKRTSEY